MLHCDSRILLSYYYTVGWLSSSTVYVLQHIRLKSGNSVKFRNTSLISLDGKSSRSVYFYFHDVSNTSIMLFDWLILRAYESFIQSYIV